MIYVDILTGKNLSSTHLANMGLIHWSVRLASSRRGKEWGKVGGGGGGRSLF